MKNPPNHAALPPPPRANFAAQTGTLPAQITQRPTLPVTASAAAILRLVGVDEIAAQIIGGATQREIAEALEVRRDDLAAWLYNLPDELRAVMRAASMASAEELLDQAGAIIDAPGTIIETPEGREVEIPPTAAAVALRKLRADHRYRKAAQRNAAYRDKGAIDTDAPAAAQAPAFHFQITVMDGAARPTITAERDD